MNLFADIYHADVVRNGRRILLVISGSAVLATGAWLVLATHPHEPVYDGKPISYWIDHPTNYYLMIANYIKGGDYPGSVDARAVPYLVSALQRREGPLHQQYRTAWHKFPAWLQKTLPKPVHPVFIRACAANELARLGPVASPAIPVLMALSTNDDELLVRNTAAQALAELGKLSSSNGTTN